MNTTQFRNLFTSAATLALLTGAAACASAVPARAIGAAQELSALKTLTHTAGEAGFSVNSHLIFGEKEAILVDTQFTRSEARQVVKMIQDSGRELKAVFVTHGHPDHYFGFEQIARAFPNARLLARPEVIADIQATAQGKLDYWKALYKDDLADGFTVPQPFTGDSLTVDGQAVAVIDLPEAGESEHASVLYIPSSNTLVAGDLAYNGVHLWLVENKPEGWIRNLAEITRLLDIKSVLSGHGPNGDASLLADNRAYIEKLVSATAAGSTQASAKEEMNKAYGSFKLPIILELSVGARVSEVK